MIVDIEKAVEILEQGDVVAIPTETVYGLAANAMSDIAVEKIYQIKQRPNFNPLIIHVDDLKKAKELAVFSKDALKLAEHFWENNFENKALTIVAKNKNNQISKLALGGLDTVAIRIPNHPIALEIIKKCGFPIAAPSANPSQKISTTDATSVLDSIPNIPVIDGGSCKIGLESTIVDMTTDNPVILRHGSVTIQDIEKVLSCSVKDALEESNIKAPGMMLKHYSPKIPLRLNAISFFEGEAILGFGKDFNEKNCHLNLSESGNLEEAAHNLFRYLRKLDQPIFTKIAVAPIPNLNIGIAINDKLKRASYI